MTCRHEWDSILIDNYRSFFCTKCEKTETEEYCDGWDDATALAAADIAALQAEVERLRAMIPDPSTSDRFHYDLGRRDAQVLIDAAQQQVVDVLNASTKEVSALQARVKELEAVLGDARQWIGARNTHGGHITEALLSRLDRLAAANGGKG